MQFPFSIFHFPIKFKFSSYKLKNLRTNWRPETGDRKLASGQSLFELVIAIGMSALIIVVLVSLVSNALQNANFSKNETLAGRYAEEATEWLRSQRDSDTDAFESNVSKSFNVARCFNAEPLDWSETGPCVVGTSIKDTPFVREITFISNGNLTKTIVEADVKVSWTDSKGLHEVSSATVFSDWRQR